MIETRKPGYLLMLALSISLVFAGIGQLTVMAQEADLTVKGPEATEEYTLEEVKDMAAVEGWGGMKDSVGNISGPTMYKGVSVKDLVEKAGTFDENKAVKLTAKDGYSMSFSYDQVVNGDFLAYDPATGNETEASGLRLILAYQRDGEPIGEDNGPMRAVIVDGKKQVTDGHWWVKWIEKVELVQLKKDWTLKLEGELSVDMDRSSFESGASASCHGASWTDGEGNKWSGVPLWLLVGYVDDENKHEKGSFNEELANEGYTVEVTATDGYSKTFESSRVMKNNDMIVANKMNGEVLPEEDWPLRLVGPNLQGSEMVSKIAEIKIIFK